MLHICCMHADVEMLIIPPPSPFPLLLAALCTQSTPTILSRHTTCPNDYLNARHPWPRPLFSLPDPESPSKCALRGRGSVLRGRGSGQNWWSEPSENNESTRHQRRWVRQQEQRLSCRISLRSCDRALGQGNLAEARALCKAGGTRGPWGGGNGRIACDRAGMYSKSLLTAILDTGRARGNLPPSCRAHVQSEALLETKVGSR